MNKTPVSLFLIVAPFLFSFSGDVRAQAVTRKNIQFISYPGFPEGVSTWGSIGYSTVFNKVVIGVTNHRNKQAIFEYDVASRKMQMQGLVHDMAHLQPFHWQGKIHSKIAEGPGGEMYFSTDGGENREEYLMDHPQGYGGGFLMKWNIETKQLTNLGMPMLYESIKDVEVDEQTGTIYAISYPSVHFLIYEPATNKLQDLGRLGSSHVPRIIFTDQWANCYYVDWRQRLVKYEKEKKALVFATQSLPAFPGTPGSKIITGVTGFAKDATRQVIYLVTYGAKLLAFYPQKDGIGKIEDLGGIIDTGKEPPYGPYCPNISIAKNGKLYYFIGGHENYVKEKTSLLVEFDPETRQKKIVLEFPISEVSEVTGCNVVDKEGNLYFAGVKHSGAMNSLPFMIKFNPEKELN